jgi:hypothetical protein
MTNLQTVLSYYGAMVEKPSFDAVQPFVNEDFLDHNAAMPAGDLDALRAFCEGPLANDFANIHVDVRHTMVDGAYVLLRIDGRLRPGDRDRHGHGDLPVARRKDQRALGARRAERREHHRGHRRLTRVLHTRVGVSVSG